MSINQRLSAAERSAQAQLAASRSNQVEPSAAERLRSEQLWITVYRRDDPFILNIYEVYLLFATPAEAPTVREACADWALIVIHEWQTGAVSSLQYNQNDHGVPEPPFFQRYDVWADEFDNVTRGLFRAISRQTEESWRESQYTLQDIREIALRQILKAPHHITFPLEDFGLEEWMTVVRSHSEIRYGWAPEEYQRILTIREHVAADPEQQRIEQAIHETRAARQTLYRKDTQLTTNH